MSFEMNAEEMVRFSIIGCGVIGRKRAMAIKATANSMVEDVFDLDAERAASLAASTGCRSAANIDEVLKNTRTQCVIISTTNNQLVPLGLKVLEHGKHLLLEKPGARNAAEFESLLEARELAERKFNRRVLVHIGYNLRQHPSFRMLQGIMTELGQVMHIRARYGHGGRVGYDREWRANPEMSGGGELIDQGVHLIDLCQSIMGDIKSCSGHNTTSFWDMSVDDNAFMFLQSDSGATAWLHASCTEWKNIFSFEIFGKLGKLQIDGLGGSYGTERLTYYRMTPEMGPPETTMWEFPRPDDSWHEEIRKFSQDIRTGAEPTTGLVEGLKVLKIVEELGKNQMSRTSGPNKNI